MSNYCDKSPLQAILNEGLEPLFEAVKEATKTCQPYETFGVTDDSDNLVKWYVSKRLGWQGVTTTPAYVFTEHYGALEMPVEWSLLISRCRHHFEKLGHDPKVAEVYEWLQTPRAQELLKR